MPASGKLIADFNPALAAGEKLTSFLRERVFSKNTTIHASVPLSKRLIFVKEPGTNKPREELNATAAEMERTALKAVINLVEVSQLVDLPQLLEHRVSRGVWSYSTPTSHSGRRKRSSLYNMYTCRNPTSLSSTWA